MNNNEILDSIKKAFKLTIDKLDNHYMFYLDEMVTPKLITLFYWILLFAFITKGLGDIFLEGDFWRGLVWVVVDLLHQEWLVKWLSFYFVSMKT